ncbi:MAG: FHA domain-containing protein [Proteobacteria bacterium]|nr:FHA domain-containing protein [Pseudomonadota bacterium]
MSGQVLVSRHHAMLVRHGSVTLLMDLNSANGTYVNSWRISNQVLVNDDVIMVGEHGIKFVDASAHGRAPLRGVSFDETVVLKSMQEMQSDLDGNDATTGPAEGVTDKSLADSARS